MVQPSSAVRVSSFSSSKKLPLPARLDWGVEGSRLLRWLAKELLPVF